MENYDSHIYYHLKRVNKVANTKLKICWNLDVYSHVPKEMQMEIVDFNLIIISGRVTVCTYDRFLMTK